MDPRTDTEPRRRFPKGRWLAKQLLVRWDVARHRRDESIRPWVPALAGARAGHVVVPSKAVASSRGQAMDYVRHRLVRPGDRVLDVGAGNGRSAIGLLEIGVAAYVGLDVVRSSVEYANRAFRGHGDVRFDFLDVANEMYNPGGRQRPDEVAFPYADGEFDFVVAGSLYTHLERRPVAERYVDESARVLREGGGAYMSFFRSPPNAPSASAVRTVFAEGDIRAMVEKHFVIEDALNGTTTGFHDQWMLYLRKRPA